MEALRLLHATRFGARLLGLHALARLPADTGLCIAPFAVELPAGYCAANPAYARAIRAALAEDQEAESGRLIG